MRRISFKFKTKEQGYVYMALACIIIFLIFYIGINRGIDRALENNQKYNIEQEIKRNGNLFSKIPLGNNYKKDSPQSLVYSILVYNKSWRIHRILEGLIGSGGLLFGIIGVIIGNLNLSRSNDLDYKRKIKTLIIFTIAFVLIFLIINYFILKYTDSKNIEELELIKTADKIYKTLNIWKPNIIYNFLATIYVIVLFLAYGLSGLMVETLINNILISVFLYGFLGIVFNFYPISPVFFMIELSPLFLVTINPFIVLKGAKWYYFIFAVLMFGIYYFLGRNINRIRK